MERLMSIPTVLAWPDFAESVVTAYARSGYTTDADWAELCSLLSRRSGWPKGWMWDLHRVG